MVVVLTFSSNYCMSPNLKLLGLLVKCMNASVDATNSLYSQLVRP